MTSPSSSVDLHSSRPFAVLVLGMHRSGTSVLTHLISAIGATPPTNLVPASETENPLGFWESEDVIAAHEAFLAAVGSGWHDPLPLPAAAFNGEAAQACRDRLLAILNRDFPSSKLFVLKDPRMCRLVPLWRRVIDEFGATPLVVVPWRNPYEVAASLARRSSFSQGLGLALWLEHVLVVLAETHDLPRLAISYADLLENGPAEVARLQRHFGMASSDELALSAVPQSVLRPEFRHHRLSIPAPIIAWVHRAVDLLIEMTRGGELDRPAFDQLYSEYCAGLDTFGELIQQLRLEVRARRAETETLSAGMQAARQESEVKLAEADLRLTQMLGTLGEEQAAHAQARDAAAHNESKWHAAEAAQKRAEAALSEMEEANHRLDLQIEEKTQENKNLLIEINNLELSLNISSDELSATKNLLHEAREGLAGIRSELESANLRLSEAATFIAEKLDDEEKLRQKVAALRGEIGGLHLDLASAHQDRMRLLGSKRMHDAIIGKLTSGFYRGILAIAEQKVAMEKERGIGAMVITALVWMVKHGPRKALANLRDLRVIKKSGLFDAEYYASLYPDVAESGTPPLVHFIENGWRERRQAGPLFDCEYYLSRYSDVAESGRNPLTHYIKFGATERRNPSSLFDAETYLTDNPDVAKSRMNPAQHYLRYGWREGRNPSPLFDTRYYLHQYPDVAQEGINPLVHFVKFGAKKMRRPSPGFDTQYYVTSYPDVVQSGVNPLAHFLRWGMAEGRLATEMRIPLRPDHAWPDRCILFISHGLGGGTAAHCQHMISRLAEKGEAVVTLSSKPGQQVELISPRADNRKFYALPAALDDLVSDLRAIGVWHIHIHHMINFGPEFWDLPTHLGVRYDITLHDFAFICPRVHMLRDNAKACTEPQRSDACDACVAEAGAYPGMGALPEHASSVAEQRNFLRQKLAAARCVFAPSRYVRDNVAAVYDLSNLVVRPHPEDELDIGSSDPGPIDSVRIAVIGSIGPHKGFDILMQCAEVAVKDGLPLSFIFFGEVSDPARAARHANVTVLGSYRREDLPDLLRKHPCHLAAFFSICPETYSYALSEALQAGLFPVSFDIGAIAERIQDLGWGNVIPVDKSPRHLNQILLRSGLERPLPPAGAKIGLHYPVLLDDYYQLERPALPETLSTASDSPLPKTPRQERTLADYLKMKLDAVTQFFEYGIGRRPETGMPLELFIEASNVCNLKCAMCAYFSALAPNRLNSIKSTQRGFFNHSASDENLEDVIGSSLIVHCSGFGEPTIHPEFRDLLEFYSTRGNMVDFITNGMTLDEDFCEFLVEKGVAKIMVSFSGATKEEYEAVYIGGDFDKVINGLRTMREVKKRRNSPFPVVHINSLAFTHHVEKFDQFCDIMFAAGVDGIELKPLVPYMSIPALYRFGAIYRSWVDEPVLARAKAAGLKADIMVNYDMFVADGASSPEEYERRVTERTTAMAAADPMSASPTSIFDLLGVAQNIQFHKPRPPNKVDSLKWTAPPGEARRTLAIAPLPACRDGKMFACIEPWKTMYVRRNGEVKPCCFGADDTPFLGNIHNRPAAEIWTGPGYRTVRAAIGNGLYPADFCRHCLQYGSAPPRHHINDVLFQYFRWMKHRLGLTETSGFPPPFDQLPSDILIWLQALTNDAIVDNQFSHQISPYSFGDEAQVKATIVDLWQSGQVLALEGHIDRIDDNTIRGWVWSPVAPQLRHEVEAWFGGALHGKQLARQHRSDLAAASKGDGRYGFSIDVDRMPTDEERTEGIDLRIAGTPMHLPRYRGRR